MKLLLYALSLCTTLSFAQKAKDPEWISTSSGCKFYNPNPKKNETVTWTGRCEDGYGSGEGVFTWFRNGKKGSEYTGSMKRGRPHGKGKYVYDGVINEGNYENGKLNGYGTSFEFHPNGDTIQYYAGLYVNGEMNGAGRIIDKTDRYKSIIYEGIARDDMMAEGTIKRWTYYGSRLNEYYEGDWHNAMAHGNGKSVENKMMFIGKWEYDRQVDGKFYYDSILVYEGQCNGIDFHGVGTRYYFDGSKYYGEFSSGRREGFGKLSYPDGRVYIGEFKDDLFEGYGVFSSNSKVLSCGVWDDGKVRRADTWTSIKGLMSSKNADKLRALNLSLDLGSN